MDPWISRSWIRLETKKKNIDMANRNQQHREVQGSNIRGRHQGVNPNPPLLRVGNEPDQGSPPVQRLACTRSVLAERTRLNRIITATRAPHVHIPSRAETERRKTGKEGERRGYQYLRQTFPHRQVTWTNEKKEKGHEYDVVVSGGEGEEDVYYEVKASKRSFNEDRGFHISPKEIRFAERMGSRYNILRILLHSSGRVNKITTYANPWSFIKEKRLVRRDGKLCYPTP